LGRSKFAGDAYDEVVLAATTLASNRVGALIVIERNAGLENYVATGVRLEAALTYDLLVTIFSPHTPLHDGAVIIRDYRLIAASCFLPLTLNPKLSKELGTRHRAAIGVTEDTDAIAIVVSEETGTISFVEKGEITRHLDSTGLRNLIRGVIGRPGLLGEALRPVRHRPRNTSASKREASRKPVSETFIK